MCYKRESVAFSILSKPITILLAPLGALTAVTTSVSVGVVGPKGGWVLPTHAKIFGGFAKVCKSQLKVFKC